MSGPIGYYVHHHGDGHRQRALAIARAAAGRVTLLGTGLAGRCGEVNALDLPDDRPIGPAPASDPHDVLHYAPAGHPGVRERGARLVRWIAEARPALMVVDVSVEVAMLARLTATPFVYARLSGRRDDGAHRHAFAAATALLAPFAAALDDEGVAEAIRRKTFYAPGLMPACPRGEVQADTVLGVVGQGGDEARDGEAWAAAARATPAVRWEVIGRCRPPADMPPNLTMPGWVEDAGRRIARAGVVVGAAGDGLVGSVAAAGRPFVCIPEARPFDEQRCKAARLAALGAAVVREVWPPTPAWPELLAQARALDPAAVTGLAMDGGERRAAAWLLDLADRVCP